MCHQRLRFIVGNTADSNRTFYLVNVFFKFSSERRVLNVVNSALKFAFACVNCNSASARAEMRMIISSKKQIHRTIVFGSNAENTAHKCTS